MNVKEQSNSNCDRKGCVKFDSNHTGDCKTRKYRGKHAKKRKGKNWLARQTFYFWNDSDVLCLSRVHWHQEFTSAYNRHKQEHISRWCAVRAACGTHQTHSLIFPLLLSVFLWKCSYTTNLLFVFSRAISLTTSFSFIYSFMGESNANVNFGNVSDWMVSVETIVIIVMTVILFYLKFRFFCLILTHCFKVRFWRLCLFD